MCDTTESIYIMNVLVKEKLVALKHWNECFYFTPPKILGYTGVSNKNIHGCTINLNPKGVTKREGTFGCYQGESI